MTIKYVVVIKVDSMMLVISINAIMIFTKSMIIMMIVSITISMIIMMVSNNNAIMISPYRLGTSLHRGPFTKWGIATSGMSTIVTNIIIIVIMQAMCLFQMEQTVKL